jgi:ABC-type nitrate/sulfonate/bicarbonate transport system ATPase subunit
MIAVEALVKSYAQHTVIDNLTFTIPSGRSIALLGASGCGKSVLFHLLAGLIPPSSGRILLGDTPLVAGQVSYMQQKDLLLPWYSLQMNAALPLILAGLNKDEAFAQVDSHLEIFGLRGFERHYPNQLSGGMRQRVALLRTLLHRKPILLMDEPFSALDALSAYELRGFTKKLKIESGCTLFFVTHNVDEALDLADEIWIMHKEKRPQLQILSALSGSYETKRATLHRELGVAT